MENTLLSILWCLTVMIMLTINSVLILVIYLKLNYLRGILETVCASMNLTIPAQPKRLRDVFREPPAQKVAPKTAEEPV